MSINSEYYSENIKNISHITFSIYTNDDVKKYSHISEESGIILTESYENYEPKKGGLVDLRLGTCDLYITCNTCGENSFNCPGHFGHTTLAEPVFHLGFLNHLKNILQCVCLKCSSLLVSSKDIHKKKNEMRFKEIKNLTKNVTHCYICGTPVPKIKKDIKDAGTINLVLEYPTLDNLEDNNIYTELQHRKTKLSLSPKDCYQILKNISDEDAYILGFNTKFQKPSDLIIEHFPIPPITIRPTAKLDFVSSATMEDSITLKISDIIRASDRIKKQTEKNIHSIDIDNTYQLDLLNLLQLNVATYFDNESVNLPKTEFKTGGRETKSISARIKGKTGRMRNNIMGKRVDFSARTVITSDPYIDIDQVGVPKKIAMELTVPEEVTSDNIKYLTKLVKNGRNVYPGANFVIHVSYVDGKPTHQKIDLKYRKKELELKIGDVVDRHMINGDHVLFNRQPTLHKPSMMGHKVHILNNDVANTFRLNVSVCKPYNADFDGDEMNLHLAQSVQTSNEIKYIANVKYQIVGWGDSKPIIGCQQDTLSGAYMLSLREKKISGKDAANLICNTSIVKDIDMRRDYTGNELFSLIIDNSMNINKKNFVLENGNIKNGTLDASLLSFKKNSIIHYLWDKFGGEKTKHFIDDSQRLILNYLLQTGQTIGYNDTIINEDIKTKIKFRVYTELLKNRNKITFYENSNDNYSLEVIENNLAAHLNTIQSDIGNILMKEMPANNFFQIANLSGARGKITNVSQIFGVIGQQMITGSRLKYSNNRTLVYFHRNDDTPEARGFIKNTYCDGLTATEFFTHVSAGREGLIDTAIKTAQTGYIQRQLIKGLEDLVIKYDNTNRNCKNLIIQFVYGENSVNQIIQSETVSSLIELDNKGIESIHLFNKSEITDLSKKIGLTESNINNFNKSFYDTLVYHRDKLRVIQEKVLLNHKIYETKFMIPINIIRLINDYKNLKDSSTSKDKYDLKPQYIISEIDKFIASDKTKIMLSDDNFKYSSQDNIKTKFVLHTMLYEYLSPKLCILQYKFTKSKFDSLINDIYNAFNKALVSPGEMVGIIAAQSIGEPTSQLSTVGSSQINIIKRENETDTFINCTIGEFCDEIIKNNPDRTHDIVDHSNSVETDITHLEYFIPSVSREEKVKWCKISHVSRHPPNGKLTKITTKSGRSVETTLSHSHLIRKENFVVPIVAKDLKLGMRIPISRNINNTEINDTVVVLINKKKYITGSYLGKLVADYIVFNKSLNEDISTLPNDVIPDFIFTTTFDTLNEFIKVYLNNANINITDKYIEITDNREKIISGLITLLSYDSIFCHIINPNVIHIKYNYFYRLKRLFQLNLQFTNYINDEDDVIEGIGYVVRSACKIIGIESLINEYVDDITRFQLSKILNLLQLYDTTEIKSHIKYIEQAVFSDVIWDEIVSISTYDTNEVYVYDFTVPGLETFAVNDGVLIHNTLDTKHFAGASNKTSTNQGVSRIQELLHFSKNIKTPQMAIYFKEPYNTDRAAIDKIVSEFKYFTIKYILESTEIYYDINNKDDPLHMTLQNDNVNSPFFVKESGNNDIFSLPIVIRFKLNLKKMLEKNISTLDVKTQICSYWQNNYSKNTRKNNKNVTNKIINCVILSSDESMGEQYIHVRVNMYSFNYDTILEFTNTIIKDIRLKGIENIKDINIVPDSRTIKFNKVTGAIEERKEHIVYTSGINFNIINYIKGIDTYRTKCNDVFLTYRYYGIEAARSILLNEFVLTYDNSIGRVHLTLLVDQMCHLGEIISIDRHGLSRIDTDPISKASFEKTMDHFINAAIYNEKDMLKSVSSRIALGKVIDGGTGAFDIILDTKKIQESENISDMQTRLTFIPLKEDYILKDIINNNLTKYDFLIP